MEGLDCEFYQYRPLGSDQIRLLEVEPCADSGASVFCTLQHYTHEHLDDIVVRGIRKKQYETLSYTWGGPLPDSAHLTDLIFIDGQPFRVTSNLNQALKRFRQLNIYGKMIWVDALCIDQDHLDERSQQVSKMDNMYWNSRNTMIRQRATLLSPMQA